jgi:glycosyltransferase involved in cell wall biosynthesis
MTTPLFSIVIPAFDEERFLPACLDAIDRATAALGEPVEVIVVDNDSRDGTAELARSRGARVVLESAKNLSVIRNRGAREAAGRYLAFIDADSVMSDNMLVEVRKVMKSGRYVGGGVLNVRTDRFSIGMVVSAVGFMPVVLYFGVSAVMFYTTPAAFQAVGGFDEHLYAAEDLHFGRKLKRHGRSLGLRYKNLLRARVTTSSRKLDEFGDWYVVRHPLRVLRLLRNDRKLAHDVWYRPRR